LNEQQKLRVLIPHWIEHNQEHAQEFTGYSDVAGDVAVHLQEAAEQMRLVNQALAAALEKLGGALAHEHHHTP
jgi:aminoglycoside phosphotransferase